MANLLILAGVCGVLVWVWALSSGALYQYVQRVHFARETAAEGDFGIASGDAEIPEFAPQPRETAPEVPNLRVPGRILPALAMMVQRDPRVIARLEVPSVGLTVMVREGVDNATLRKAVGHLPSSVLPGERGNFVVLGHRDTFFRPLRYVERGNAIHLRTTRGNFEYFVDSVEVVPPESAAAIAHTSDPVSTLITCFPFDYTGPAPRRFIVRARLNQAAGSGQHLHEEPVETVP
jgi:LPXTG-site transpeptidase (sortase) family protein